MAHTTSHRPTEPSHRTTDTGSKISGWLNPRPVEILQVSSSQNLEKKCQFILPNTWPHIAGPGEPFSMLAARTQPLQPSQVDGLALGIQQTFQIPFWIRCSFSDGPSPTDLDPRPNY